MQRSEKKRTRELCGLSPFSIQLFKFTIVPCEICAAAAFFSFDSTCWPRYEFSCLSVFFQRLLPLRYKIRSYCHGQSGNQFSKRVENGKQIVSFVMICRRILFSFCLTLVQCLSLFHIYFFRLAIVNRFYGKFSDCTDWFSFLHNWRNNIKRIQSVISKIQCKSLPFVLKRLQLWIFSVMVLWNICLQSEPQHSNRSFRLLFRWVN